MLEVEETRQAVSGATELGVTGYVVDSLTAEPHLSRIPQPCEEFFPPACAQASPPASARLTGGL